MRKPRILLVEDETDVIEANAGYLREKGYEVCEAETLRDAWNYVWEYPPDLILLDVLLPDGSGYAFCERLREASNVPVIFLTAMGDDACIVDGLRLGGDDYIVKPYNLEILGARIAAQLRRRESGAGHIDLPPLHIDITTGVVRLNQREIALSRKEFQLLLYLVEHQGQELSQAQLFEAVWHGDPERMGSTVRVAVSRLRQRLALEEEGFFEIATTGKGYIFLRIRIIL